MTGIFPSMTAIGGTQGLIDFAKGKKKKCPPEIPTDKPLSELMSGNARMVDTYSYDYVDDVVHNDEPFAIIDPCFRGGKIAVIGSGFAGVTASYELSRALKASELSPGDYIDIYEAQDRVGGRVYSPEFRDTSGRPYYNEMGAMRVPDNSKLFWNYFSKVEDRGLETIQKIFPNPGVVATELYFRGGRYSWLGIGSVPEPDDDVENPVDWGKILKGVGAFIDSLTYDGLGVGDIYDLLVKPDKLTGDEQNEIHKYWKYFLEKYDDIPFIAALSEYVTDPENFKNSDDVWGPTEFNMFSTLGFGTGGFGPLFPVCFLEIFRLFLWDYASEFSPSMAMDEIIAKFINLIYANDPDKGCDPTSLLKMHTVVYVGLDAETEKPIVFYIDLDGRVIWKNYDYVIVGTTLRSMQIRLNLDSEIVPDRYQKIYGGGLKSVFGGEDHNMVREAIRIPQIMNSSKLFGMLEHKPWTNPQWAEDWGSVCRDGTDYPVKCVLTDTLARQMYFLDPYPKIAKAGSNVLISYNWGDDSVKIMGILDYEKSQVITQDSNPDFNLKVAYELGISSALPDSIVAEVLKVDIPLCTGDQEKNLQSIVWQQEPMIFGAFKIDYPEQYYYTSQMVYQYHAAKGTSSNRVYVANNNCSFQGGWIEGAMQSGINAAAAVLKTMQCNDEASGFRMDNLFEPNPFEEVVKELGKKHILPPSEFDAVVAEKAQAAE